LTSMTWLGLDLLANPDAKVAEHGNLIRRASRFAQEAHELRGSDKGKRSAALAGNVPLTVLQDEKRQLVSFQPPDLRHAQRRINLQPVERAACHIDFDRQIRGRVAAKVEPPPACHPRSILDPETLVGLDATLPQLTPQRRGVV